MERIAERTSNRPGDGPPPGHDRDRAEAHGPAASAASYAGDRPAPTRVLGRLLVDAGVIDDRELAEALLEQRGTRERLGEILIRRGVSPDAVARALARQLRMPYAEAPLEPDAEALALVDRALALRVRAVPLRVGDTGLRIAVADPLDVAAIEDLRFQTGQRIEPAVAVPATVDRALAEAYGEAAVEAVLGRMPASARSKLVREPSPAAIDEVDALRRAAEAAPIVALVELILERAVGARASDVHIEPADDALRVRARVDGLLRELVELPAAAGPAIVSRIKVMAGLDIATKRRPQDGRGAVRVEDRELGLRVSTLPTQRGEKVVMRLLDAEQAGRPLDGLGLGPDALARLRRLLGRGHGVLLVTGPTGSGKTTTLYGALASLDRERRNVITLEDPVEYRLPGLTQVQVHRRAGLGFAAALRAVLRQDPDVVMVGEMRDRETVEVGMAAAMTGHLVLSTLHTNDAAGAVARLVEMGAPPYLVAGGLIGVVAQRLARRLCRHCRTTRDTGPDELRALGLPARPVRLYAPAGCTRCDGVGFRGRAGLFEVLVVDTPTREAILAGAGADAIRDLARGAGMRTLGHDAWRHVREGATTLEEVRPLLTLLADEAPVCGECGTSVRRSFVVCPGCGAGLRRVCPCGQALQEVWRWCPACATEASEAAGGGGRRRAPGAPLERGG